MDEYVAMFALSRQNSGSRLLGCADGPASFNAEMHARGRTVVSVDPIYRFSAAEIQARIDKTFPVIMQQLRENADDYLWTRIPSPEALGQIRMQSMESFLADFADGKEAGRYLPWELPLLPFEDRQFDLVLCSHFLFLYSEQLSAEFHRQAIQEMLRVAGELRIFPLLTLGRQPSPHLDAVCRHFRESGRSCEVITVDYEFQRGGNRMLRIR